MRAFVWDIYEEKEEITGLEHFNTSRVHMITHFLGVLGRAPAPMPISMAVAVAREHRREELDVVERGLPLYLGLLELLVLVLLDMLLFSMLVTLL